MSPGRALAAARREAGLSVAEVSQKTRIREAIIRGIEQDDYSACGGDFYARGHIRAMARAAGADPAPLIREYDAARRGPDDASDSTDQFAAIRGPFEPLTGPAGPKAAAHGSLGNVQLVDEGAHEVPEVYKELGGYEAPETYEANGGYEASKIYGADESYGAAGTYGADESYEAPKGDGVHEAYGAAGTYGADEGYEEPSEPTAAYGSTSSPGESGRPDGTGSYRSPGVYGTDEGYRAAGTYGADEGYEEPSEPTAAYGSTSSSGESGRPGGMGGYRSPRGYGADEGYRAAGAYGADEGYEELSEPTAAYGSAGGSGGSGGMGGYRRVDELARDFDGPYKFDARFDADEGHEAPGEPASVSGDRSWFLGLTEPPGTGQPARPGGPARPARTTRVAAEPRRPGRWAAVSLVLLAALGLVAYLLLSSSGSTPSASSRSPGGKATTSHRPSHSPSPGRTTSPPSSHSAPPPAPQVLRPVSAVAFGPSGPGQGDDPQDAGMAIDHAAGTFWQSDWYATARFGNLQPGTGLLLDMGHPVTITGAQVTLGAIPGANLELRAGSAATLGSLRTVASASNAGGLVQLHAGTPVTARYVLIWFTRLPPNANGNFQAKVYNIKVQ